MFVCHSISSEQERDNLSVQLENIENKAMKSFATIVENDIIAIDADEEEVETSSSVVVKQMNELKKKIGEYIFKSCW